jgi:hypothetical protein
MAEHRIRYGFVWALAAVALLAAVMLLQSGAGWATGLGIALLVAPLAVGSAVLAAYYLKARAGSD